MKCAVLVLCAATAAAAFKDFHRRIRHHHRGDVSLGYQQGPYQQGSYQQGGVPYQQVYQSGEVPYQQGATYQYSGEVTPSYQYQLSGEATPSYQYQPQYQHQYAPPSNSLDALYQQGYQQESHQQGYHPSYPTQYQPVAPTQGTPVQYGAPLAPYPPQFNVHQQAQYGPLPGYTDLFGPTSPPGGTLITPTAVIKQPSTTAAKAPATPQAPNNIFSLLLSLSQSSSGLSQPRTTKRPVATIATTHATAQPSPKAQIYSFANLPSPFQRQPVYYPQRRNFNPFSLQ